MKCTDRKRTTLCIHYKGW